MPIYEYLCEACTHRFEVRQRLNDAPLTACERCGKPVTKVISPPAIMFKGSGWYVTDYSDKLKEPKATEPVANGKTDQETPASTPTTSTPAATDTSSGAKEAKPATPSPAGTSGSSTSSPSPSSKPSS